MKDMLALLHTKGFFGSAEKPTVVESPSVSSGGSGFAFGSEESGSEFDAANNVLRLSSASGSGGLSRSFEKEGLPKGLAKDFVIAHESAHQRLDGLMDASRPVSGKMENPRLERLLMGTPGKNDVRDGNGVSAMLSISLSGKQKALRSARYSMMETWCDAQAALYVSELHSVPLAKVVSAVRRSRTASHADFDHDTSEGLALLANETPGSLKSNDEISFRAANRTGQSIISGYSRTSGNPRLYEEFASGSRESGGEIRRRPQPDASDVVSRVVMERQPNGVQGVAPKRTPD